MTDIPKQAENLFDALDERTIEWDPRFVTRFDDNDVIVIIIDGAMPFHAFPDFDDFFLVLKGECVMDIEGSDSVPMREGDVIAVPKGVKHRPRSEGPCHLMVIERSLDARSGPAPS